MIHYLLQIIGFQLLFLLAYELFLKKETFFTWNRAYLLITPILSLILPFIKIPALQQSIPESYRIAIPEILLSNTNQDVALQGGVLPEVVVTGHSSFDLFELLLNVWYLGMAIGVLLFAIKLYKIWKLQRAGESTKIDGLRVIILPHSTAAFSFFNTMFLGKNLSAKQRESIVLHEAIHIKERHSIDLLFFEIQRIFFWFNPLVYAFQNNMILLQEYTADARVAEQLDTKKYYQGLLSQVFQTENISFINTFFNHSFIKKRITMLQKSKSTPFARFKYVLLIPVVCAMLFYVACSEDVPASETSQQITNTPNFSVLVAQIGDREMVTIGVRDRNLLNPDELLFIKKAKFSKGLVDFKNPLHGTPGESFKDFDEMFFVENSLQLQELAKEKGVKIDISGQSIIEKQELGKVDIEKVPLRDLENIPFAVIEQVPTYPGCSGTNEELRNCMTEKISQYVGEHFNYDIGDNLDLEETNRIFVAFRIDKNGNVTNVRSRAAHPVLETEATRVIQGLPKMQPGEQDGRPVGVLYSLPITFKIQE